MGELPLRGGNHRDLQPTLLRLTIILLYKRYREELSFPLNMSWVLREYSKGLGNAKGALQ